MRFRFRGEESFRLKRGFLVYSLGQLRGDGIGDEVDDLRHRDGKARNAAEGIEEAYGRDFGQSIGDRSEDEDEFHPVEDLDVFREAAR